MLPEQRVRALLAAVAAIVLFIASPAHAAAPLAKTQSPGYYRMMLGDFEVTALSDGTVPLAVDTLLTNTSPAKVNKALDRWFLKEPVDTSVNAYLINTGTKLVLVDAGAGALFGPRSASSRTAFERRATGPIRWTRFTSLTCMRTTSAA